MPFDEKALQAIKNRETCWVKHFEELFALIRRRIRWIAPKVGFSQLSRDPGNDDIEGDPNIDDFVAYLYIDYYFPKAQDGTLIKDYVTAENAEYMLASYAFIGKKASDYLSKHSGLSNRDEKITAIPEWGRNPDDVKGESVSSFITCDSPTCSHSEDLDFYQINLHLPDSGFTKTEEQAGMQLYPRVDWTLERNQELMQHLEHVINDCQAVLTRSHKKEAKKYAAILGDIRDRIFNNGEFTYRKEKKKLENRHARYLMEMIFYPLSADTLCEILDISKDNAYQLRKRYKDALPELLSEYKNNLGISDEK